MKSIYPIILITLFMSGCSTIVYQEPLSGDRARVRYATDSGSITVLYAYNDKNCATGEEEWMRLTTGTLIRPQPKTMGLPLNNHQQNAAKEVYVQSTKPTYSMFTGSTTVGNYIYSCGVPFSYHFETGKDYEVFFKMYMDRCSINVAEIVTTNGTASFSEKLIATNKLTDENKGCMEAFKKGRLY